MENWVILTLLYAICIGFFQVFKKKAIEKNSIYEVLAFFSLISFLIVAFTSKNVLGIELEYLLIVLVKSVIIVFAWLLSLYVISKISISLFGVINLSKIIFSIMLSIFFLGEKLTVPICIGMFIVISGLLLVNNISKQNKSKEKSWKMASVLLISCFLSSISVIIDKKVLDYITIEQLQFWFLLFLTIGYWIILIIKKEKINFKNLKKNYWIPIVAICLIVSDRLLFMANEIPESKVSIMSIIKPFSTIEVIILGKIIFKEKNIIKKLVCSLLIILGIMITLI